MINCHSALTCWTAPWPCETCSGATTPDTWPSAWDTQEAANLKLAAELGYEVDPAYIWREQGSGADQTRPLLAALQRVVVEGKVDAVFIYDTDRLARDPLEVLKFIRQCKEFEVRLHFADGTSVQTAEDEAIQYLRGFLGQQERVKTRERTMRGKRATALAGRMHNGLGRGFYGYDYDPATKTVTIIDDEAKPQSTEKMSVAAS